MNDKEILNLAAKHNLVLLLESLRINDMGLDFKVAIGRTESGEEWVLRIPRFPSVMKRAKVEAHVLHLVASHLDVAVPDWQIHSEQLIAYPLLPGVPGLELDEEGNPEWFVDISSPKYSASMGEVLAQLHSVPIAEATDTGVEVRTPQESRVAWYADIDKVKSEFTVSPALLDRWTAWLADDSYWPKHSVFTHGEIYAGHTLVHEGVVSAVIDWTTAAVGDPARDLMFQQAMSSPESFDLTLEHYERGGGKTWGRLVEHCSEMFSTSPLNFGLYALETGDAAHRQSAAALLNPE